MSNEIRVCSSCWEVDCECDYEEYIELDEMIAEIIIEMNLKGYPTFFSCEGHIKKDDGNLDSKVFDMYLLCKDRFDVLPEGFSYPRGKDKKDFHRSLLYKYKNGKMYVRINGKYVLHDLESDKLEHIKKLRKWVNELPARDIKSNPSCFSTYMVTGKPKTPRYIHEIKDSSTYKIEITSSEFERVSKIITGYCGKIVDAKVSDDKIVIYYFATKDLSDKL